MLLIGAMLPKGVSSLSRPILALAAQLCLFVLSYGDFHDFHAPHSSEDFWGSYLVTKNGVPNLFEANGFASYRWNVSHSAESRFPIGSNTKLFTAIAIYQLQERGLLNVSDSVTSYLNGSDFAQMGLNASYHNQSRWCPMLYGDTSHTCQNITFIQLLSMSSGLLPVFACSQMYNTSSPFYPFCWDYCTFQFLPYSGSIGHYVAYLIKAPMIFAPGAEFSYNNMNFILASYLVEKLSNMPFGLYLKQNIFDVLGLENTYCDLWDGNFEVNLNRVDEYYLPIDTNVSVSRTRTRVHDEYTRWRPGWCHPYTSMGMSAGSGCVVSSVPDMNLAYQLLFNRSDAVPKVFQSKNSRRAILTPWTLMGADGNITQYYGQGIMLQFDSSNNATNGSEDTWPDVIYYNGAINCCHTAMKMVATETDSLVINAFSNAMHVYINGEQEKYGLEYSTPYSICQMAYVEKIVKGDFGGPYWLANELLKLYTNGTLK